MTFYVPLASTIKLHFTSYTVLLEHVGHLTPVRLLVPFPPSRISHFLAAGHDYVGLLGHIRRRDQDERTRVNITLEKGLGWGV